MDSVFEKLKSFGMCSVFLENQHGFKEHLGCHIITDLYLNDDVIEIYIKDGDFIIPLDNIIKYAEDEEGLYLKIKDNISLCFMI